MLNDLKERAEKTGYSMHTFSRGDNCKGDLNFTIWTKVPKIEVYTSRGQSYIAEGDEAVKLAQFLLDEIALPILNNAGPAEPGNARGTNGN